MALKEISAGVRRFGVEMINHLYAQAAEAGVCPMPNEVLAELGRIVVAMLEESIGEEEPQQVRGQAATDLEDVLGSRLYKQLLHDAVDAYCKHKPGFKKGKPGRPINEEEAERFVKLLQSKSYREVAKETLPEGERNTLRVESERDRIRAVVKRQRRRQSK